MKSYEALELRRWRETKAAADKAAREASSRRAYEAWKVRNAIAAGKAKR